MFEASLAYANAAVKKIRHQTAIFAAISARYAAYVLWGNPGPNHHVVAAQHLEKCGRLGHWFSRPFRLCRP
jgi:hypothetical protein